MTLFVNTLKSLGITYSVFSLEHSVIEVGALTGVKVNRQVFCFKGEAFTGIYTDLS